ncbi:hypothetical protein KY290_017419 [Solanum tuberosum]|uniref:Uncharacterized protein n=1 Tax=Solanum tuberosum TaxID=4113 RepID=A0ABQ7VD51_SOLTU|nr:hypothetical protein KY290_017419 [Solanum tuberosum]
MVIIWDKLKQLKGELKGINAYMASYAKQLNQARQQLERVQGQIFMQLFDQALFDQEKVLLAEIQKWSLIEEKVLRQKSRACWIDSGDANTKYFHAQMKIRNAHNTISSIYTENGIKLTEPKKKGPCLIRDQKLLLIEKVTKVEIDQAIKSMPHDKSPGEDGYPIEFFTSNWEMVKEGVYDAVQ